LFILTSPEDELRFRNNQRESSFPFDKLNFLELPASIRRQGCRVAHLSVIPSPGRVETGAYCIELKGCFVATKARL
jgi:hypothetical protein